MTINLKIALYGASEGTKTLQIGHLIDTFGASNVGILSCEGGLSTIRSRIDPQFVRECASLEDLRKGWTWAAKTFTRPDQWVCVDGGSRALQWVRDENWGNAERAMEEILEGRQRSQLPDGLKSYARFVTKAGELDGQRIWVQVGTECERLLDAFIKLPCSVYWNFWEEMTSVDQYTRALPWKPDTPGKGAFEAIRRSFDYVGRLERAADGTVKCTFRNSPKAFAKRRDDWNIVKVPDDIAPFRLDEFVRMLEGASAEKSAEQ